MNDEWTAKLRESLAAYAHSAWANWIGYMWSKALKNEDGSLTIPVAWRERWTRQAGTPYAKLPESEKESDRAEADKMLALFCTPLPAEEEYIPQTEAEIDANLRQAGYDPEQVGRMGVKVALMAADASPLNPKNRLIASLEAELAELKKSVNPVDRRSE